MKTDNLIFSFVKQLSKNKDLKAPSKGFTKLADSIAFNQDLAIEELVLSGNDIGEEGAIAIAKSLEVMKKGLKTLDLSNAGITPKGISSIFSAFIANKSYQTSLTELTLSNNTIGKAGGEVLCKWFSTADKFSLRKLFLSSTKTRAGRSFEGNLS